MSSRRPRLLLLRRIVGVPGAVARGDDDAAVVGVEGLAARVVVAREAGNVVGGVIGHAHDAGLEVRVGERLAARRLRRRGRLGDGRRQHRLPVGGVERRALRREARLPAGAERLRDGFVVDRRARAAEHDGHGDKRDDEHAARRIHDGDANTRRDRVLAFRMKLFRWCVGGSFVDDSFDIGGVQRRQQQRRRWLGRRQRWRR